MQTDYALALISQKLLFEF